MSKVALITGVGGQDGSYLSQHLLSLGYRVIGLVRRSSVDNQYRLADVINHPFFHLEYCDINYADDLELLTEKYEKVDEIYHLAAQSHVGLSFKMPGATYQSILKGTGNILALSIYYNAKMYHASSSEQFGDTTGYEFQNEQTPFRPLSPYARGKTDSHIMMEIARRAGHKTYNGILFNHESPRRGEGFVTRKITKYIGDLLADKPYKTLELGNIESKRDWGYAGDYVKAMHLLLQQDEIYTVVIATGRTYTIRRFLESAFEHVGLDYKHYTAINTQQNMRPNDVTYLCGDASLAKEKLGWEYTIGFEELVKGMVDADVQAQAQKV